jgi:hypothetical protein
MKIQDLADRLGVTADAVAKWRKSGMPCSKTRLGRIEIDERQAAEWFARTGKINHAQKLIVIKTKENNKKRQSLEKMSSTDDLESMLARCRQAELDAWNRYQSADPIMVGVAMEQHREQAEARRKVEKDIAAIRLSQQEVVPRCEVEKTISNMAIACKGDLLSIPDAFAEQLVGLTAAEIAVKLRSAITDALRHISVVSNGK